MTKAKSKRLLSLLLSLALVFTMVAPVCAADNTVTTDTVTTEAATETAEEVTTIDTVEYTAQTVNASLPTSGAVEAGTYTLTDDVTLTGALTVASGTEVIIDLNGHTVSYSGTGFGSSSGLIANSGTLTIQDSSADGSGKIDVTASGTSALYIIYNKDNGVFALAGGTLQATSTECVLRGIQNAAGATTTVTGGTINLTGGSKAVVGIYTAASKAINFTSGTISVSNSGTGAATGIYISKVAATVNVNSGSITATNTGSAAAYGIYEENTSSSAATINVQSGTITATSNSGTAAGVYKNASAGTVTVSGGTISATSTSGDVYGVYTYYASKFTGTVVLSGGTISAKSSSNTADVYGWYTPPVTLTVTGGSITAEGGATAYVATKAAIAGETYDDVLEDSTFAGTLTDGTTVAGGTFDSDVSSFLTITKDNTTGYYYYYVENNGNDTYTVKLEITTTEVASVTDASDSAKGTTYPSLQKAIDAAGSGDTVTLLTNACEDVTIAADDNITLDLNGKTLTGTGIGTITADSAASVTTHVITVSKGTADAHATLVIKDSSTEGTGTITGGYVNKKSSEGHGAGVYILAYGDVTLESGTISGNSVRGAADGNGGGVYVGSYATFTMNGGTISGNYASRGAAVYVYTSATFTMNGGTIDDNEAVNYAAVFLTGSTVDLKGGTISNNNGNYGGGVYVGSGTLTIEEGATITGNTADVAGGGVYVAGGTAAMIGGNITNNTAPTGGGVYVAASSSTAGTFNMSDGVISGNSTTSYGGGVYVGAYITSSASNYGTFDLSGGTISSNTAATAGGGVYVAIIRSVYSASSYYSIAGVFQLSGNPVVVDNTLSDSTVNNVHLVHNTYENYSLDLGYSYITLVGDFTGTVGVTTDDTPTEDTAIQITTAEDGTTYYSDSIDYFFSDLGYDVVANDTGKYLELSYAENIILGISDGTDKLTISKDDITYPTEDDYDTMYVKVSSADIVDMGYDADSYPTTTLTFNDDLGTVHNYIFAGWYYYDGTAEEYYAYGSDEADEEHKDFGFANQAEAAYAKFIDATVLTVKFQITANTETTSETTSMRVISSLDALDYDHITFKITFNDTPKTVTDTTAYTELISLEGTANAYTYAPSYAFSTASNYFITATILNIPNAYFDETFTVVPYWTTTDGTTVTGTERSITINQIIKILASGTPEAEM